MSTLICGRNPVLEALRAGTDIGEIRLARGTRREGPLAEIMSLAQRQGIPLRWVDRHELDAIARGHQGVVASSGQYRYADVEEILARANQMEERPFILILDCLQDVNNFGSLLRTAEAVGVHGVIIPQRRAVGVTTAVRKTSAGAVEHMRVARVTNLTRAIEALKDQGLWIIGLEAIPEALDYRQADLDLSLALVVGGEGQGMRRLVRQSCDLLIRIPMRGAVNSLNAAVAGSIALYEAWHQRSRGQQADHELDSRWQSGYT